MTISIITLFPEMFSEVFAHSIIKRAQKNKKIEIRLVNLRQFGAGKHKVVDDKPYGGGTGMMLKVEVLAKAIEATRKFKTGERVILLDPRGEKFDQAKTEKLSKLKHIILVCGHYEGFDERVRHFVDMEISIGDYVMSGGEIPAIVVVDAVTRLIPGVLKKEDATQIESFSKLGGRRILEYPQYTRPKIFKKLKVPDILLSGHKEKIKNYRLKQAKKITKKERPDLLLSD